MIAKTAFIAVGGSPSLSLSRDYYKLERLLLETEIELEGETYWSITTTAQCQLAMVTGHGS